MIGYGIWLPVLAMAGAEFVIQPSLEIVVAYCYWALMSGAVIFITFLASFVHSEDAST